LPHGFDIAALKAAGQIDDRYLKAAAALDGRFKELAQVAQIFGVSKFDLPEHVKAAQVAMDAARLFDKQSILGGAKLDSLLNPRAHAIALPRAIDPVRLIPPPLPKHRPEAFYYSWRANRPVQKGIVTCDFWRHQKEEEIFEFEVLFTKDGEARGIVECTVHAENLTKPEQAKVTVARTLAPKSMLELARAMVEASD
jgi:hypothetical protein